MAVHKLIPSCKDYLWGGDRLQKEFGKQSDQFPIAESWELSCHPDGACFLADSGLSLAKYLQQNPSAAGNLAAGFGQFPVLIKLIDSAAPLSVQVHPDDAYALSHEGQLGKTEMWYVVDCLPGAYLYYGFQQEITPAQLREAIEQETLCELLRPVPVQKGDVFFIEAGTVHAIGEGIVIAEVQQSSNVTYRVYDYGRVGPDGKPRALHVDKACEVACLHPADLNRHFGSHLAKCEYFTVDKLTLAGQAEVTADADSFHSLLVLEGQVEVSWTSGQICAGKGDSLLIEACTGVCALKGQATILHTYLEKPVYRIGIDLGGTNIKAGVVDEQNRILAAYSCKTLVQRPWQQVVEDMAIAACKAAEKAGVSTDDCVAVGVGSPGTVDAATGMVVYSNNFPGWENIPLGETLGRLLGIPVAVSNDANCAALGEAVAGAAAGARNVVLLTLGTGVGGGVVADGKLFEGGGPGGAELGHTTLLLGGKPCTCGRLGCLESYCSATALIREASDAARAHPQSLLNTLCGGDLEQMDGKIPFDAMCAGDRAATAVVEQYLEWLGAGIVNMVNIFRPEVVLLSGGICAQGERLTVPLNDYVRRHAFAGTRVAVPEVRRASLGNNAGIVGAANLI